MNATSVAERDPRGAACSAHSLGRRTAAQDTSPNDRANGHCRDDRVATRSADIDEQLPDGANAHVGAPSAA
jgi:hypothetical protein